jgi:hypothetical protein
LPGRDARVRGGGARKPIRTCSTASGDTTPSAWKRANRNSMTPAESGGTSASGAAMGRGRSLVLSAAVEVCPLRRSAARAPIPLAVWRPGG